MYTGRTDAKAETPILWPPWCEELTHWESPWCWERLKAGGEGDGGDGWMASPTRWTQLWASSRSWWWTGRPGVLQFMGSQRVRHDWAAELNWAEQPQLSTQLPLLLTLDPFKMRLTMLQISQWNLVNCSKILSPLENLDRGKSQS